MYVFLLEDLICLSLLQKSAWFISCSRFTWWVGQLIVTMSKIPIKPLNAIFQKKPGSKDLKKDTSNCQIHKYSLWRRPRNTQDIFELLVVEGCKKLDSQVCQVFRDPIRDPIWDPIRDVVQFPSGLDFCSVYPWSCFCIVYIVNDCGHKVSDQVLVRP